MHYELKNTLVKKFYLIVHFTNGFSCMYIISSTDGFATNLTLAAFWMIMFLCKFYGVSFDFLFTDATFILLFLKYTKMIHLNIIPDLHYGIKIEESIVIHDLVKFLP